MPPLNNNYKIFFVVIIILSLISLYVTIKKITHRPTAPTYDPTLDPTIQPTVVQDQMKILQIKLPEHHCKSGMWYTFDECWKLKEKNIQEYFSLMQKNCSSVIEIIAHGFHGSFINELVRAVASSYEVGYSFISGKWDAALAKENCFNADNSWSCLFEEVNFCSRQNIKDISTIQYLSKVKESYPSNLSLHLQIAEIRYNTNDYLRSNIWDSWMKKFDVPASFMGNSCFSFFISPRVM